MKILKVLLSCLCVVAVTLSCSRDEEAARPSANQPAQLKYSLVAVLPTSSFSSFGTYWNYNYPWGTDHNGSARMRSQNATVSGGVLTCSAVTGTVSDKASIHYFSGTVYAKQQVTVSDAWPLWRVSGEFQCPSAKGTWPAFWLNNADGWPPEADIMEFKGSAVCWSNTYKNQNGQWSNAQTTISSPANWHTYTAWISRASATDVKIEYWIDGVKVGTHTGQNFMNDPMNLIIDLQMEGSSGTPGPSSAVMKARNVTIQRSATL